jgi:hypothetical protein
MTRIDFPEILCKQHRTARWMGYCPSVSTTTFITLFTSFLLLFAQVVVRIRPPHGREPSASRTGPRIRQVGASTLDVVTEAREYSFKFDTVLGPETTQEDVYDGALLLSQFMIHSISHSTFAMCLPAMRPILSTEIFYMHNVIALGAFDCDGHWVMHVTF